MEARCACAGLRASSGAAPLFAIACHCLACQRRTGAPFGTGVYYARNAVTVVGDAREYARATESGGTMRTLFCPICGTSLCWTIDAHSDLIGIAIGAIEGDPDIAIHSLWERTKRPWVDLAAATIHHPRGYPEG